MIRPPPCATLLTHSFPTRRSSDLVIDQPHAITLRTSIIGHELTTAHGLLGWFLAQPGPVRGFSRAIFSGLPTVELARVIRDVVLPRPDLKDRKSTRLNSSH